MENGPFIVDLPISLMGIPQKILQFCGSNSFHDPIASTFFRFGTVSFGEDINNRTGNIKGSD
jgi:hypothetical protein